MKWILITSGVLTLALTCAWVAYTRDVPDFRVLFVFFCSAFVIACVASEKDNA